MKPPQLIYGSSLFEAIEKGLLPGLEYNGTNYLYNLEPKANNLFYVGNLSVTGKATETDNYSLPNTRFRVNKISFPFMKLQFDAPSRGIPTPLLKSVALGNTCSITWVEDVYPMWVMYDYLIMIFEYGYRLGGFYFWIIDVLLTLKLYIIGGQSSF